MSDEEKMRDRMIGKVNFDLAPPSTRKIVTPEEAEESMAIRADMKICGTCKFFDLDHGQYTMMVTRFLERLVQENNWQVRHLCSHPKEIGICSQSLSGAKGEEATLTGVRHKACDMHRERNGLVRIRRK